MKATQHLIFFCAVFVLVALTTSWTSGATGPHDDAWQEQEPVAQYVGAKKCKTCHNSKAKGEVYTKWEALSHANAFEVLATDEAKEVAAAKGIEDAQKADECLKCHTTGHGADKELFAKSFKAEYGIQCETCHGPGSLHVKTRLKAAAKGEGKGEGILDLGGKEMMLPTMETCLQCHNPDSPSYKEFDFGESLKKIQHLHPKREKPRVVPPKKEEGASE